MILSNVLGLPASPGRDSAFDVEALYTTLPMRRFARAFRAATDDHAKLVAGWYERCIITLGKV